MLNKILTIATLSFCSWVAVSAFSSSETSEPSKTQEQNLASCCKKRRLQSPKPDSSSSEQEEAIACRNCKKRHLA